MLFELLPYVEFSQKFCRVLTCGTGAVGLLNSLLVTFTTSVDDAAYSLYPSSFVL